MVSIALNEGLVVNRKRRMCYILVHGGFTYIKYAFLLFFQVGLTQPPSAGVMLQFQIHTHSAELLKLEKEKSFCSRHTATDARCFFCSVQVAFIRRRSVQALRREHKPEAAALYFVSRSYIMRPAAPSSIITKLL